MKSTLLTICLLLLLFGCNSNSTGPSSSTNLITNSTFEVNGKPSLEGWIAQDTSIAHFSSDVPNGPSRYSLVFHVQWFGTPNSIYTTVIPRAGQNIYRLSCWMKKIRIPGNITVAINEAYRFSLAPSDSIWINYSRIDTLNTVPGDTLVISLSGGWTELGIGTTYFANPKFEILD